MSTEPDRDSVNDPVDLLDELDSIIRAQEILRHRMIALGARYAALEPYADRFDEPDPEIPWLSRTYGSVNIDSAKDRLSVAARRSEEASAWLSMADECAEKIREYPKSEREQDGSRSGNAIADAMVRTVERDGAER